MFDLIRRYQRYSKDFYSTADKRMDSFPLMSSWWYTVIIIMIYLAVIKFGTMYMKRRPAFDGRMLMVLYNGFMVILSTALVVLIGYHFVLDDGTLSCWMVDYSNKGYPFTSAFIGWLFYVTKLIELIDTMFFVIRKKFHLLTFLHVFHHAAMPLSVWFGIKFASGIPYCDHWMLYNPFLGGSNSIYPWINSFVHILMYTYYGLGALGPQYAKLLWWKKYMTQIQMIQFVLLVLHSLVTISSPCNFPKVFTWAILIYGIIFFLLFLNYYIKTYKKEK